MRRFEWWNGTSKVAWNMADIWELASRCQVRSVEIEPLLQSVSVYVKWFDSEDWKRVELADLNYPPILTTDGRCIIDGVHRCVKMRQSGLTHSPMILIPNMPLPVELKGEPFEIPGLAFEWRLKDGTCESSDQTRK